jgi:homoserine O-acetyltransferase/O-succinyltransferase
MITSPRTLRVTEPLALDCGQVLPSYTIGYETYGTLSPAGDNAILVCHSLTKGAHAAGRHAPGDRRPGWWDAAIGPGKMLDTDRYFVVSTDTLAAGRSTGPASTDPATGRAYGLRFPVLTVCDMVAAQHSLARQLGITTWHCVIGGCFGGQQAVQWAIRYPAMVRSAVVIATTPATSAHTIAIFAVMRHLIRADPAWNGGDYYDSGLPVAGLGAAVAAGVPLWMNREAMQAKFGRRGAERAYTLDAEFDVERFIGQVAQGGEQGLDPNGLMYLMRAVEYFDLAQEYGSLDLAAKPVTARMLLVSYHKDWRYPAAETELLHRALVGAGADSTHAVLSSAMGHGAFLVELGELEVQVRGFLD